MSRFRRSVRNPSGVDYTQERISWKPYFTGSSGRIPPIVTGTLLHFPHRSGRVIWLPRCGALMLQASRSFTYFGTGKVSLPQSFQPSTSNDQSVV
jgi:hypothetical protein